jgi:hypothetical protein
MNNAIVYQKLRGERMRSRMNVSVVLCFSAIGSTGCHVASRTGTSDKSGRFGSRIAVAIIDSFFQEETEFGRQLERDWESGHGFNNPNAKYRSQ